MPPVVTEEGVDPGHICLADDLVQGVRDALAPFCRCCGSHGASAPLSVKPALSPSFLLVFLFVLEGLQFLLRGLRLRPGRRRNRLHPARQWDGLFRHPVDDGRRSLDGSLRLLRSVVPLGPNLAACPTLSVFPLLKQGIKVRVHVNIQHVPIISGSFIVAELVDHFKVVTIANRHRVSFLIHILDVGLVSSCMFPYYGSSFVIIQIQQGIGIIQVKLVVILRLDVIVQNGIFSTP